MSSTQLFRSRQIGSGVKIRGNKFRRVPVDHGRLFKGLGSFLFRLILVVLGLAVIGGISFITLAGYRWTTNLEYFQLREVDVTGNNRLAYGEILHRAGLTPGRDTLEINPMNIETELYRDPWIASVKAERILPDKVRIEVREKEASFWVKHEGKLYYADINGRLIAPVEPSKFVSLPILSLVDGGDASAPGFRDFMQHVGKKDLPFAFAELSSIGVSGKEGLELRIDDKKLHIRLSLGDWEKSFENLKRVWADLERRGELETVADVRVEPDKVWLVKK